MTTKRRYIFFLCIMVVCAMTATALPALAADMAGRDTRFLMPGETPTGGATTTQQQASQRSTYTSPGQGTRDMRFLTPGETPSGGGMTPTQQQASQSPATSSPGQGTRDTRFLTPAEASGSAGSPGGTAGGGSRATGSAHIGGCKEWVNVRNDPSTAKSPTGKAYLGEGVTVQYWNNQSTWAYVTYSGGTRAGWISGDFIKTK